MRSVAQILLHCEKEVLRMGDKNLILDDNLRDLVSATAMGLREQNHRHSNTLGGLN